MGELLTRDENQERIKECGKAAVSSKIYKGRNTTRTEAPWTLNQQLRTAKPVDPRLPLRLSTATVISKRHILTDSTSFVNWNDDFTEIMEIQMTGNPMIRENCRGNDYVIEDVKVAENVKYYSGLNETIKSDDPPVAVAKKIVLIGACGTYNKSDESPNLAIIETIDDFNFTAYLNQACLSISMDDAAPFVLLDFYGYGRNPGFHQNDDSLLVPELLFEQTRVIQPHFAYRSQEASDGEPTTRIMTRSWNERNVACPGDFGGAAMRRVRGRHTLVGVLVSSTCQTSAQIEPDDAEHLRTNFATEYFVPIPVHTEKICEYTGICSASRRASIRLLLLLLFMTLMMMI